MLSLHRGELALRAGRPARNEGIHALESGGFYLCKCTCALAQGELAQGRRMRQRKAGEAALEAGKVARIV